jgi:asparagine synthase (glutamine-hydrolysing)
VTFTAYFPDPGFDERPYAEAVVAKTRADAHWVTFDDHDVVAALPAIVEAQDEPFGSTSIVAQWFVLREAKRAGLTVLLDGQGADEILASLRRPLAPSKAENAATRGLRVSGGARREPTGRDDGAHPPVLARARAEDGARTGGRRRIAGSR